MNANGSLSTKLDCEIGRINIGEDRFWRITFKNKSIYDLFECDTNVMFVGSEKCGKRKLIKKLNYQFKIKNYFSYETQEELSFKKNTWKNSKNNKEFNFWKFSGDKKVYFIFSYLLFFLIFIFNFF